MSMCRCVKLTYSCVSNSQCVIRSVRVDVGHLRGVDSVEVGSCCDRVRTHVLEDHHVSDFHERELLAVIDRVEAIAGGAEDAAGDHLLRVCQAFDFFRSVVVSDHAVEGAVGAIAYVIVDIWSVSSCTGVLLSLLGHEPSSDNLGSDGATRVREEATRLSNNVDFLGEEIVQQRIDLLSDLLEANFTSVISWEPAADI